MAKKLMMNQTFTASKAMIVMIINVIVTALTFWQTQNFEVSAAVFTGMLIAVLAIVLKYVEAEVPTPTPTT